jgi:hypothetical protein
VAAGSQQVVEAVQGQGQNLYLFLIFFLLIFYFLFSLNAYIFETNNHKVINNASLDSL